jgi:ubiquitin-protein ligase
MRRLRNDLTSLERLQSDSSVFRFTAQGNPPQRYLIFFKGTSLWRDRGKVRSSETHRLEIKLGASYPRTLPEIRWITPIFHPNISEIGMVCLGGYGTHWVPSVQLDELCNMLWDMARYHNYDIRSPYNREAALWVASQATFRFPMDPRPLRDLRAAMGRIESHPPGDADGKNATPAEVANGSKARPPAGAEKEKGPPDRVRQFINRYGAMLIAGGNVATRRRLGERDREGFRTNGQSTNGPEPDRDSARGSGLVTEAPEPVSFRLHPQDEEVVLLDSATPAGPQADPSAEPRPEGGDGITFIE